MCFFLNVVLDSEKQKASPNTLFRFKSFFLEAKMKDLDNKLIESLMAVISEQTPQRVSEDVRTVLNDHKNLQEEHKNLQESHKDRYETIQDLKKKIERKNEEISELKTRVFTQEKLEKKAQELAEQERNIKVERLEYQLEQQQMFNGQYQNILEILCKSPVKRKEIHTMDSVRYDYCPNTGNQVTVKDGESTTITEREYDE